MVYSWRIHGYEFQESRVVGSNQLDQKSSTLPQDHHTDGFLLM